MNDASTEIDRKIPNFTNTLDKLLSAHCQGGHDRDIIRQKIIDSTARSLKMPNSDIKFAIIGSLEDRVKRECTGARNLLTDNSAVLPRDSDTIPKSKAPSNGLLGRQGRWGEVLNRKEANAQQ